VTPAVRTLLIATVGTFFFQKMMPGIEEPFVFVPQLVLLRPWSIVTYMFLHGGLGHLFFNMLALFFFGPQVESRIGTPRFVWLYFLSGIAGALLSFVFAFNAAIIGASGGVFGVSLAFAYFWPNAPIYIWGVLPVPARILVIVYGLFSIWGARYGTDNTAHFAHLGGYAGAFLYLKWIERRKGQFRRAKVDAPVRAEEKRLSTAWKSVDRTKVHEVNRDELDRILDKISAQGIDSLTAQEKTFLMHFVPPDDRDKVPPTS
jgi:membrane associated rhomboid family serine protease